MLEFIINILSTPAILVGLMSLLGLALQRKPIEDIVKGTVKTIVGFLVLSAGASFLPDLWGYCPRTADRGKAPLRALCR